MIQQLREAFPFNSVPNDLIYYSDCRTSTEWLPAKIANRVFLTRRSTLRQPGGAPPHGVWVVEPEARARGGGDPHTAATRTAAGSIQLV